MKEKVIETAGRVWEYLKHEGKTNINKLPKLLNEKEVVVFQALGWLAREDKINYLISKRQTFISLSNK